MGFSQIQIFISHNFKLKVVNLSHYVKISKKLSKRDQVPSRAHKFIRILEVEEE